MSIPAGTPPGPQPRPCSRCRLDHDPVSFAEWAWHLRDDIKPADKPPGGQIAILLMLASRLDPRTGCGWTTRDQLAEDVGGADPKTVTAATEWAAGRGLLHRQVRGHNITPGRSTASMWILLRRHPTGKTAPVGEATQRGN